MFMCVVNLKSVNKLDLTWKQSFLIRVTSRWGGWVRQKQNGNTLVLAENVYVILPHPLIDCVAVVANLNTLG
jgi:hypothetical protein